MSSAASGDPRKRRLSDSSVDPSKRKGTKRKKLRWNDSATSLMGGENGAEEGAASEDEKEKERQRLSALLSTFSTAEMERYTTFRRSHLKKHKVRTLMSRVSGQKKISDELAVSMGGIAKIFAGELIEAARQEMKGWAGPILPLHIRAAYRRLRHEGKIDYLNTPARGLLD